MYRREWGTTAPRFGGSSRAPARAGGWLRARHPDGATARAISLRSSRVPPVCGGKMPPSGRVGLLLRSRLGAEPSTEAPTLVDIGSMDAAPNRTPPSGQEAWDRAYDEVDLDESRGEAVTPTHAAGSRPGWKEASVDAVHPGSRRSSPIEPSEERAQRDTCPRPRGTSGDCAHLGGCSAILPRRTGVFPDHRNLAVTNRKSHARRRACRAVGAARRFGTMMNSGVGIVLHTARGTGRCPVSGCAPREARNFFMRRPSFEGHSGQRLRTRALAEDEWVGQRSVRSPPFGSRRTTIREWHRGGCDLEDHACPSARCRARRPPCEARSRELVGADGAGGAPPIIAPRLRGRGLCRGKGGVAH